VCLIVLSFGEHPDYPLVLAANRDEFHARPTRNAQWWPDKPGVVGGRDLQAGGTWLALHKSGRFATVTNFRDAQPTSPKHRSRGHLVTGFLEGNSSPKDYLEEIDENAYAGFNLIVGTVSEVAYLSNRENGTRELSPGTYGLSNALLDGPWHKVESSRQKLAAMLAEGSVNETSLIRLMNDRNKGDFTRAHAITAPFIVMPDYGTRCTTVVLADRNGNWHLTERRFSATGDTSGESRFTFSAQR
jgi:uncharacterized protein with NRDE domain